VILVRIFTSQLHRTLYVQLVSTMQRSQTRTIYVFVQLLSGRRRQVAHQKNVNKHLAKQDATLYVVMMIELSAMMALLMAHVLMAFTTRQTKIATRS
jgi:hypothetical protein